MSAASLVLAGLVACAPAPAPDPTPAPTLDPASLAQALADLPSSPSLAEVQRAAQLRAGVSPGAPRRWRRRSRGAAALPTASVQFDHRLDQSWTLDQEAGSADSLSNDGQNQSVLRVKLSWELDRLVYSPDELRVARAALDLDDWRARVLTEVTLLYFERERLLLDLALQPPADLEGALSLHLRLREVEGLLAASTGLDFARGPTRVEVGPVSTR